MLDPDKEGRAYMMQVRSGAMTLAGMVRELGEDPDEHFAEIAATNALLDRLGIRLDSDPRHLTQGGQQQMGQLPSAVNGSASEPEETEADLEDDGDDEPAGETIQ
jgi:capsid protein